MLPVICLYSLINAWDRLRFSGAADVRIDNPLAPQVVPVHNKRLVIYS